MPNLAQAPAPTPESVREFLTAVAPDLADWGFTSPPPLGMAVSDALWLSTQITLAAIRGASTP